MDNRVHAIIPSHRGYAVLFPIYKDNGTLVMPVEMYKVPIIAWAITLGPDENGCPAAQELTPLLDECAGPDPEYILRPDGTVFIDGDRSWHTQQELANDTAHWTAIIEYAARQQARQNVDRIAAHAAACRKPAPGSIADLLKDWDREG